MKVDISNFSVEIRNAFFQLLDIGFTVEIMRYDDIKGCPVQFTIQKPGVTITAYNSSEFLYWAEVIKTRIFREAKMVSLWYCADSEFKCKFDSGLIRHLTSTETAKIFEYINANLSLIFRS